MGARHSKRSVDITTTPKKGEDGAPDGDDAKLEKVAEPDLKVATNGGLHAEIEFADKDETSKEDDEEVKENGVPEEPLEAEAKGAEEEPASPKSEEAVEPKKKKEKKKKWSFRSISFSRKDKSKPTKEAEKNGDVTELAEESAESSDKSPSDEGVAPALTNGDSAAPEATPEPVQAEVAAPEPVQVEVPAPEEPKQEEVPPPLPASNPPSPITVFAESTKAPDSCPLAEEVTQIPLPPVEGAEQPEASPTVEELPPAPPSPEPEVEPPAEPAACPAPPEAVEAQEEEPATPPPTPAASVETAAVEVLPSSSSPLLEAEPVARADSLQDISTESLPSLPEPVSESLAPLSLPPVDFVPAPIAEEVQALHNGHSSPSPLEEATPPGPTKQVIECQPLATPIVADLCRLQVPPEAAESGDQPADSTADVNSHLSVSPSAVAEE